MFSMQPINNENKLNNTLSLTIRLSNTLTVPITINSLSPANDIIDIIGKFILFQNKPILFFKGKHIQPYISLKAQGIKTGDEIVVYDKLITSLININSQLKYDPIKKTNQEIANIKKWQNTQFLSEHDLLEKTYVCVLNEIKRLVDQWFTNLENIFPDSVLYADLMEEEDSNEQIIELKCDDNSPCSIASLLNRPNDCCLHKVNKIHHVTVIQPTPKEISDDPLPMLIPDSNSKDLNTPFLPNPPTGWNW